MYSDELLEVFHNGQALPHGLLRPLNVGDIRPGPDDLQRTTRVVMHDLEGILDPEIVPSPMPEAVFDGPSSFFYQRIHFGEDPLGILRMETAGPELWIFKHLPRGIPHNRVHILADERARVIARGLIGVKDPRTDRHKVL